MCGNEAAIFHFFLTYGHGTRMHVGGAGLTINSLALLQQRQFLSQSQLSHVLKMTMPSSVNGSRETLHFQLQQSKRWWVVLVSGCLHHRFIVLMWGPVHFGTLRHSESLSCIGVARRHSHPYICMAVASLILGFSSFVYQRSPPPPHPHLRGIATNPENTELSSLNSAIQIPLRCLKLCHLIQSQLQSNLSLPLTLVLSPFKNIPSTLCL